MNVNEILHTLLFFLCFMPAVKYLCSNTLVKISQLSLPKAN